MPTRTSRPARLTVENTTLPAQGSQLLVSMHGSVSAISAFTSTFSFPRNLFSVLGEGAARTTSWLSILLRPFLPTLSLSLFQQIGLAFGGIHLLSLPPPLSSRVGGATLVSSLGGAWSNMILSPRFRMFYVWPGRGTKGVS